MNEPAWHWPVAPQVAANPFLEIFVALYLFFFALVDSF